MPIRLKARAARKLWCTAISKGALTRLPKKILNIFFFLPRGRYIDSRLRCGYINLQKSKQIIPQWVRLIAQNLFDLLSQSQVELKNPIEYTESFQKSFELYDDIYRSRNFGALFTNLQYSVGELHINTLDSNLFLAGRCLHWRLELPIMLSLKWCGYTSLTIQSPVGVFLVLEQIVICFYSKYKTRRRQPWHLVTQRPQPSLRGKLPNNDRTGSTLLPRQLIWNHWKIIAGESTSQ